MKFLKSCFKFFKNVPIRNLIFWIFFISAMMIGVVLAGGAGSISAAMPSMHSYGFFRFLTGKQRFDKIHKQNLNKHEVTKKNLANSNGSLIIVIH